MEDARQVTLEEGVPCVMRDGTVLYADVYHPSSEGMWPVLLMRQPYGKKIASTVAYAHPSWYARQGYMVVVQDVRGCGESEGKFEPFRHEAEDGYDAVEWAARLPQSNGKVGMYGFSYQGATQLAAASLAPPSLKAIAPAMTAGELYTWFYRGGAFTLSALSWAFQLARDQAQRAELGSLANRLQQAMVNPSPWFYHWPLTDQPLLWEAGVGDFYRDWLTHREKDTYWQACNWLPGVARSGIPALHVGGWFDAYLMPTLNNYLILSESESLDKEFLNHQKTLNEEFFPTELLSVEHPEDVQVGQSQVDMEYTDRTEDRVSRHLLVVGPWQHIPWSRYVANEDFGEEALPRIDLLQVEWFDYWLKGKRPTGRLQKSVHLFQTGSNHWVSYEQWPHSTGKTWYLTSEGRANGLSGDGKLVQELPRVGGMDTYVYDPRLLFPAASLPEDRRAVISRMQDLLLYVSESLQESVEVNGFPKVVLYFASSAPATDVVVTLLNIFPDGKALPVSYGIQRLNALPGQNKLVVIEMVLNGCSHLFHAGHRMALEVSSSAFPTFDRHPNLSVNLSGEALEDLEFHQIQVATQQVYHGETTLSRVIF